MTKSMAEVLRAHWSTSTHTDRKPFVDKCDGCGAVILTWGVPTFIGGSESLAAHQAEALSAAGFGLVADAKAEGVRESAAAALCSVDDIWGSVGRSVVRLSELREAAEKVLSGEWDNHLNWNLTDINRRQARARAAGMRQG